MPFLRGMRRWLGEGDRTGRYARYAVGEVFLVIIGILIALQIDGASTGNRIIRAGLDSLLVLMANPRPTREYRRNPAHLLVRVAHHARRRGPVLLEDQVAGADHRAGRPAVPHVRHR